MSLPEHIGRYRVRSVLGVGGFGTVVRAYDEELSSSVAIKVLADHWVGDADVQERFLTEARHLRRVRNPYVVSVYDIGEAGDGRPYFVMELADRGSLAERLEGRSAGLAPDPPGLIRLVTGLADGLSALHAAGLVHRDLNPRNLLICSSAGASDDARPRAPRGGVTTLGTSLLADDERIVIGDLGLAKDVIASREVSVVGGSPRYQAPEQLDHEGVIGPPTDVYAASALLWELLTGDAPPAFADVAARLPDLAPEWRPLLSRGLAAEPQTRHATAAEWADEVVALLGGDDARPHTVAGTPSPRVGLDECPYRGLAAYQPEHAPMFFGREVLIGEAVDRLRHDRTLAIAGSSGSGKSSLLRAGVIPALTAGELSGSDRWPVILMTPGADPGRELDYQLTRVATTTVGTGVGSEGDDTRMRLQADAITDATGGLVLCIDQFEELFTQCDDDVRRRAFLEQLAAIIDPTSSKVRLVIAMRADFYGHAAEYPWLARCFSDNQMIVGPMQRAELRRAITGPAARVGLDFEDGLVETMLDEAGSDAGSLPLLGHALVETWRRRDGRRLTLAGAIAQTAESVYDSGLEGEEREEVRQLLLRMVTAGDGAPHTRRRVPLDEIDAQATTSGLVQQLVDARLVTVDDDAAEIAHEALISQWPRLRDWIEDGIDDLRLRGHITRAAAEWRVRDEDPDLLYRGTPLATAHEWCRRSPGLLSASETDFLVASTAAAEEADAKEARRVRRDRIVRGLALAGVVGVVIASVLAWAGIQRTRTNERSAAAEARVLENLGLVARLTSGADPLLGIALGVEARSLTEGPNRDAWLAIVGGRQTLEESGIVPAGVVEVGDALSVTASPRGDIAAVGRRNGEIVVVDLRDRSVVTTVAEHTAGVEELVFDADGGRLASAGLDGRVLVWPVGDDMSIGDPMEIDLDAVVWGVAWSPDGRTLAAATEDGSILVLDASSGEVVAEPPVEGFDMLTVTFAPEGDRLVAGNGQGLLWSWTVDDSEPVFAAVEAHGSDVWEIVFSPDGELFATASSDGTVTIRDPATGDLLSTPFVADDGTRLARDVRGVQFSGDGSSIIAGSEEGEILRWDLETEQIVERQGPAVGSQVLDTSIGDDATAVSIDADQTLRIWLSASAVPLGVALPTDASGTFAVGISRSGGVVVSGDGAGTVRIHDPADGTPTAVYELGSGAVRAVAVSPDETTVAAAGEEGRITLIGVDDGTTTGVDGHDGLVRSVEFSPDGEFLATGGVDGIVKVWSVEDPSAPVAEFGSYSGGVTALAWRPDDDTLAAVGWDGRADVWSRDGSREAGPLVVDDNSLFSAAWSPDGETLAIGHADEVVTLWPADLGEQIGEEFGALAGGVTGVALLDDGNVLVAAGRDGAIRMWDVESRLGIGAPLEAGAGALNRLDASDGGIFVTSNEEGAGWLWDLLDLDVACSITEGRVDIAQPVYLGEDGELTACEAAA